MQIKTFITGKHLSDRNIMKSRGTVYSVPYREAERWHVYNAVSEPPDKPW